MGTISWRTDRTLRECVNQDVQQFDVDQLVKLLIYDKDFDDGDICDRINAAFRVQSDVRYDFPPSKVSYYNKGETSGEPATLGVTKFGIAAFNGPLPQPYIDWIYNDINDINDENKKPAIRDFLDIFNQRFLALRYLNRHNHRISLTSKLPNQSIMACNIDATAGFSISKLYQEVLFPRRVIQTYAGLINNPRHSSVYIKGIIASVFNAPVRITQLLGQWQNLPNDDINQLGLRGKNNCLGKDAVLGKRYWDQQGLIRIEIGPLNFEVLNALLPDGKYYQQLLSLIQYLSNRQWDCQIRLHINADDIPNLHLKNLQKPNSEPAVRLGRNSWLKSRSGLDGYSDFNIRV